MKNLILRILYFASGTDQNLLDSTTISEKIKHTGLGALVFVPALLSVPTMSFTLSTFINNSSVSLILGLVWGVIVFLIDKHIIATFRKSYSIKDDLKKPSLWARLILASFFGLAVSHPITILYFEKSIDEKINTEISQLIEKKTTDKDSIKSENLSRIIALEDLAINKSTYIECLNNLLTAEQSGKKVTLDCGESSGLPKYSTRAKNIQSLILKERQELNIIRSDIEPKIDFYLNLNKKIDSTLNEQISNFKQNTSRDYLAKSIALHKLMNDESIGSDVSTKAWFIIIFFLLIDILCVLLKIFTPIGPYDFLLREQESNYKNSHLKHLEKEKVLLNITTDFIQNDGRSQEINLMSESENLSHIRKSIENMMEHEKILEQYLTTKLLEFCEFYNTELERILTIRDESIRNNGLQLLNLLRDSFHEKLLKAININK